MTNSVPLQEICAEELEMFHQCFQIINNSNLEQHLFDTFYGRVDDVIVSLRRGDSDEGEGKIVEMPETEAELVIMILNNASMVIHLVAGNTMAHLALCYRTAIGIDMTVMTQQSLESYLDWENLDGDDGDDGDDGAALCDADTIKITFSSASLETDEDELPSGEDSSDDASWEATLERMRLFRQCEAFTKQYGRLCRDLVEERDARMKTHGGPDNEWMSAWKVRGDRLARKLDIGRRELCRRLDDAEWSDLKELWFSEGDRR